MNQRKHWESQDFGDAHGYDKYVEVYDKHSKVLFKEIEARIGKGDPMLDLGCNCGLLLSCLKKIGYKNLAGVDICGNAIEYGRKKFDLAGVELTIGSYETVLPGFVAKKRKFSLVYSAGASISLVHPSFDIIRHICELSQKYVILMDEDHSGFAYPRLWEYEFNRNGFTLVKFLRPSDGGIESMREMFPHSSLAVYQRVENS